jgi:predicted RNA-binding Zn ribbon-like protein
MPFTFVSGNLALDFAGTLRYRETGPEELLSSPARLGEWSVAAGLVDSPPQIDEAALARALAVREAVYRLARGAVAEAGRRPGDVDLVNAGRRPGNVDLVNAGRRAGDVDLVNAGRRAGDMDLVNAAAAAPPVTAALTPGGLRRSGTADEIIATIARSAVALLGGPDAGRIRECEDAPCSRLFVDTSRAGSRRWCEMSGCGNRAKAAGFRARRAAATSHGA